MIEIIQAHSKSLITGFVVLFALCFAACKPSDLPHAVLIRTQELQGDGSIVVQTIATGTHSIHYKNARQEDGFFMCDQIDVSGRFLQFHAVNYRRALVEPRNRSQFVRNDLSTE